MALPHGVFPAIPGRFRPVIVLFSPRFSVGSDFSPRLIIAVSQILVPGSIATGRWRAFWRDFRQPTRSFAITKIEFSFVPRIDSSDLSSASATHRLACCVPVNVSPEFYYSHPVGQRRRWSNHGNHGSKDGFQDRRRIPPALVSAATMFPSTAGCPAPWASVDVFSAVVG